MARMNWDRARSEYRMAVEFDYSEWFERIGERDYFRAELQERVERGRELRRARYRRRR